MLFVPTSAGWADEAGRYDAHNKRDPFAPLVTLTMKEAAGLLAVESIDDISIEGVVYDPKNGSIVIVNGSVLKEGEESGQVKVVKIKPNGVVFSVNGFEGFKPTYQDNSSKEAVKGKS